MPSFADYYHALGAGSRILGFGKVMDAAGAAGRGGVKFGRSSAKFGGATARGSNRLGGFGARSAAASFRGLAATAGSAPVQMARRGGIRAGRFMVSHPKTTVGAALGAGIFAAHPIRASGYGDMFEEELLGDPNGIRTVVAGSIAGGIRKSMYTPSERNLSGYLSNSYRAGPPTGGFTGPSGNVVFGMYNLRR